MTRIDSTITPRRGFLGRVAAATLAVGLGGALPERLRAATLDPSTDGHAPLLDVETWPGDIRGKHRQLYDAVSWNRGFSLIWSAIFLDTNNASKTPDGNLNAVVVLRHEAIPLAFTDSIWAKYKLGETFEINDPATKAPSTRNPFYHAAAGELFFPGMAIEKLLQRGVIFGVCNMALTIYSGQRAEAAGVSKDVAKQEWTAGVIPGMTVIPAGVWGVNRAQEHGCSYCYAG